MNCVIIEDEIPAIERLEYELSLSSFNMNVIAKLRSVKKAVEWFSEEAQQVPDIIFADIELGDGLSFEIFDHVQIKAPIVFTTSYNQYAIKAFEQNSISYLLKPIKQELLVQALKKYSLLYGKEPKAQNETIIKLNSAHQERFLVKSGSKLVPLKTEDVAYFYFKNRFLFLVSKDKQQFVYDTTLEILEERLDPNKFFRVNRSFIVNLSAINNLQVIDKGKLKIDVIPDFKEEIIVSSAKITQFKDWLDK
jgi:two-component system response regulator LytT